ncbi:hypothetical protein FB567DRAFT_418957, partial [Paraphoma chrysanthemicola]
PTQEQFLARIRYNRGRRKVQPIVPTEQEVTNILTRLYDPALSGPRFFYYQDAQGMPIDRVSTRVGSGKFFPALIESNTFEKSDWSEVPKPGSFIGQVWPPKRLDDVIGSPASTEQCVCQDGSRTCDCDPAVLSANLRELWIHNMTLRWVDQRGFGLFARMSRDCILGEYTGKIGPRRDDTPDDETEYHVGIAIGNVASDEVTAWIDATCTGSVTRHINHSCNPKCGLFEGRCGMQCRVIYVWSISDIAQGEELTIEYGTDWFKDVDVCLC